MATFNAGTMSNFESWTDADLVRAVHADPASKQDYVDELARRAVEREALKAQTEAIQASINDKIKELLNGNA